MGKFRRDNKSGRSQMHHAVCDNCGKDCMVPFKPTGNKPIFCDNCFQHKGGDNKRSGKRDFGDRHSRRKNMYQAKCDNCGKSCEVPFMPTSGKPVYCDQCFGDKNVKKDKSGGNEQVVKKLDDLNQKVDQIMEILSASKPNKEVKTKKKTKKTKKVAAKKPAVKKTTKKKPARKKAKTTRKKK